jgi:hypothetical protein
MNNEALILETMLEMKSQLGEIHGTVRAVDEKFDKHVEDDAAVAERVRLLERAHDKQRGAMKVWGLVGVGVGTLCGWAVEYFRG